MVQWATGNIGSRALREVIRHPDLELVGVLVTDPAKEGRDAGELCGEAPTGVLATREPEAVLALKPDCVLYMPRSFDLEQVCELLAAGINVITTRGELVDGGSPLGEHGRERVLAACASGGASAYATGSSPGFISEVLPLALLSLQRQVDSILIQEYADLSQRDSPDLLFTQMGFGQPPESFDPRRAAFLRGEFAPSLSTLTTALGREIEEWTSEGEVAVARERTTIAAGVIEAGTVAAQRMSVIGWSGGIELLRFSANWYCSTDLEPAWELAATGWSIDIAGQTPLALRLSFPVPVEELAGFTPALTANRPVNAVPWVCEAAPGILRTIDLAPITPDSLGRSVQKSGNSLLKSVNG